AFMVTTSPVLVLRMVRVPAFESESTTSSSGLARTISSAAARVGLSPTFFLRKWMPAENNTPMAMAPSTATTRQPIPTLASGLILFGPGAGGAGGGGGVNGWDIF